MTGANSYFTADHRRCDDLWSEVEAAVDRGDAAAARAAWQAFRAAMERHFRMEEELLFPALEEATGMYGMGPTQVMRMEHAQMKGLLGQMAASAEAGELEDLADHGDTLLMLIQQHNVKEEGILYPMSDQALAGQWAALEEKLRGY